MARIMAVDGNNLLIRAVKAMEGTGLSAHGVPTGALLSFVNALSRYTRQINPDRLVVCFDGGRSFYRSQLFPAYKADRADRVEDADERKPFALAKEFLALSGIHHVEVAHVEADDLIAAYWRRAANIDDFFIVSGDKDFFQLLDLGTYQYRPGSDEVWDRDMVVERMGCEPKYMPYVMALTGDDIDGVPGLPGFGTRTAVKYLEAHNWSLSLLMNNPLPKFAAKVGGYEAYERVNLNLELVDLRKDRLGIQVFEPPTFCPTSAKSPLFNDLIKFLHDYEMVSIIERLRNKSLWPNASSGVTAR